MKTNIIILYFTLLHFSLNAQIKFDFEMTETEALNHLKSKDFLDIVPDKEDKIIRTGKSYFSYRPKCKPETKSFNTWVSVDFKGKKEMTGGYYFDCNKIDRIILQFKSYSKFKKYMKTNLSNMIKVSPNNYLSQDRNIELTIRESDNYFNVWVQVKKTPHKQYVPKNLNY